MLNQIVMVGRLTANPEVSVLEGNKEKSQITIAIPRNFKNADGEYETDFVDCVLWDGVAKNTSMYCKKGDIVGVKGRIQTSNYETNGKNIKLTQVVAEKITFLSSKKDDENLD